jgi:glycosyltransferase involved in cell wall biosynthesis
LPSSTTPIGNPAVKAHGHSVLALEQKNSRSTSLSLALYGSLAAWNPLSYTTLRRLFLEFRPNVVHVHNVVPKLTPAVYHAAQAAGSVVVQTLHNYRLICPSGILYRNGQVCEACLGLTIKWPSITNSCYRGSAAQSAAISTMLTVNSAIGTYRNAIDLYIAPTGFVKRKHVEAGFPEDKIIVKPHFLMTAPCVGAGEGDFALYVGRLSEEKGLRVLLRTWRDYDIPIKLRIVGDGPLRNEVKALAADNGRVIYDGALDWDRAQRAMASAKILVVPSLWYETFGLVVMEALSVGTPVIASAIGALSEMVHEGNGGTLFEPGNPEALAKALKAVLDDATGLKERRKRARRFFESHYSSESNYEQMMHAYEQALAAKQAAQGESA